MLNLKNNNMTDRDIIMILEAMKCNFNIGTVKIKGNVISDEL